MHPVLAVRPGALTPGPLSPLCRFPPPPTPGRGSQGRAATARGGAYWLRFQIWPRPGRGARAQLARFSEGSYGEHELEGVPTQPGPLRPPAQPHPPAASQQKAAPGMAPWARPALGYRGSAPGSRRSDARMVRGGGFPAQAGRGTLTWAGRQAGRRADAPADGRTGERTAGPPAGRADGGLAAPAPRPEWIPGRERQIEREREEEEEEEAAAARGGEEEGEGPGRQPGGGGRRKRAGTDSPPARREPGVRVGRGRRAQKPRPHSARAPHPAGPNRP
ncbi:hypothetical protein P7K49_009691 [Saguinus oedipus]|uniref:Uncharacterized protein n=1 Tax=Saguinus oedipus TaxID=9490 RepID=A0ABQ9VLA5_SAGOE|nr:hypothetical protein P7K49_009691 [Saguinus oedipus]